MTSKVSSKCIKINKELGNNVIDMLKQMNLLNQDLKPRKEGNYLLIPIINEKSLDIVEKKIGFEICDDFFEEYKFKSRKLNAVIEGISSYLVIGNIGIINYKGDLDILKKAASEIVRINPKIESVYAKIDTEGELRVPKLILLYGKDNTLTIHKENGLVFNVDIGKVYFNPRLGGEHNRIANMVKDGEFVLDMFTGVGGFTLNIAKKSRSRILGVDLNPYAISLAQMNARINKNILKGDTFFIRSDSMKLNNIIKIKFDRIIMNHPTDSLSFLKTACNLINGKGNIHLYTLLDNRKQNLEKILDKLKIYCKFNFEIYELKRVLDYSPKQSIFEVNIKI